MAYLPIDPADLGRSYEAVIRINSQSGKGGVTYLLERDLGLQLPRWLQIDFSRRVQAEAEASSSEISPEQIRTLFEQHYLEPAHGYRIGRFQLGHDSQESLRLELQTPTAPCNCAVKGREPSRPWSTAGSVRPACTSMCWITPSMRSPPAPNPAPPPMCC